MNITEIKNLNDAQLAGSLASLLPESVVAEIETFLETHYGHNHISGMVESLDAVAIAEKYVVEQGLGRNYINALENIVDEDKAERNIFIVDRWDLVASSARQKCEALLLVLGEGK